MDIRELRIGNHVLYDGERMEVKAIDSEDEEICGLVGDRWTMADEEDLSPIPITEELLKELGFEEIVEEGLNMFIRFVSAKGGPFGSYIMRVRNLDDEWEFEIPPIYLMRGKHLHELEQFVFLTCKTELTPHN